MAKLFISHAAHDRALVEAFVDLLEGGVGVPHGDIFCSSLKEQSISPGDNFVASIRNNLDEATCVLALVSEAYYASPFCMCELGGVWLVSKSFLPVLVPPIGYSDLKAVLSGLQVSKLDSEEDLDVLRDSLAQRLGFQAHPTPRWSKKRKAFLEALPSLGAPFEGPVPREKFEKLQSDLRSFEDECERLEEELAECQKMIIELKNVKDAKAVAKIVRKHSSTADLFKALVSTAAASMRLLPQPVTEALYYHARGENYYPSREEWKDVTLSIEYGQLRNVDDRGVAPNERSPKVGKAIDAIDQLHAWLAEPPEDFAEWYEAAENGEEADLSLRGFWERHLLP